MRRPRPRSGASGFALAWVAALLGHAAPAVAQAQSVVDACATAAEHAQRLRKASHLREARAALVTCAQPQCPTVVRQDCTRWLAEVEAALPTIVLHARDARGGDLVAVRVSLDGVTLVERLDGAAVPVDPGEHVLRFEAADHAPVEQRVLVAEGEKDRAVDVVLPGSAPPTATPGPSLEDKVALEEPREGSRTLSYLLGGVGLVSLGAFGTFDALAWSRYHQLQGMCGTSCSPDQTSSGRTEVVAAQVALGVGVVALGVAAWFFFHPARSSR